MNARGQYGTPEGGMPRGRREESFSYSIGQGSIFGHSPGDAEDELDQLHNEMMGFGQQLEALVKKEEDQVRALVQKERDEELAAWNAVEAFQPQVNEILRVEKLLNDAGVSKALTTRWRNESAPPYEDITGTNLGKNEGLKHLFIIAKNALDKASPKDRRLAAVKRSEEISNRRARLEYLELHNFPLSQWKRSTWNPFFTGWLKFRGEKKGIPFQLWPLSGTWDRIQDYRGQFVDLYKKAPFKPGGPSPLDPDRKDSSITGGAEELLKIGKYALIGVLGIGGIVLLSSVVQNLRKGNDPAERFLGMIRAPRASSRVLAFPSTMRKSLPPGDFSLGDSL